MPREDSAGSLLLTIIFVQGSTNSGKARESCWGAEGLGAYGTAVVSAGMQTGASLSLTFEYEAGTSL